MKASFEALSAPEQQTFLVREFNKIGFSAPFHYHPEVEITLIVSGEGDRFVGSHMDRFDAGDLIMIGGNVPHCWKLKSDKSPGSCIVIQFMPDFLGDQFFQSPAMKAIGQLLSHCQHGIRLKGHLRDISETYMHVIAQESNPFELCIHLLELLHKIATSREWELLSTNQQLTSIRKADQARILQVMDYIQQHFREHISLGEIASELFMTPQAFCKFFKRSTRRTLTQVITGYRLDYATTLLTTTDLSIGEIAHECGFGDLSYFFKVFKKQHGISPAAYRNKFLRM